MSNPTREEIISAHRALSSLSILASDTSMTSALAYEKVVRDYLPPLPELTMDEIEWDYDLHYLAEAEHDVYGQVIMLGLDAGGLIEFIIPSRRDFRCDTDSPGTLTPTGKRYTLTEVEE